MLLDDPELYEAQIRRLASQRDRLRWFAPSDEVARALDTSAYDIAKRLARIVPRDGYEFLPLTPHVARLGGKERVIYRVESLDAVVWSTYARALTAAIEPRLGDYLYSYRRGRSQFVAVAAFQRFVRQHIAARPDPRARGLFVLRRDVKSYGESILAGDDSSLWSTLAQLTRGTALGEGPVAAALLRNALRPPVVHADGRVAPLERGIPTGIPTQPIACNAYLLPLDRELAALDGAFYARFGDDLLFAHADLACAHEAATTIERTLARLGLESNADKAAAFYLTGAGRACVEAPDFVGTRRVPYLGFDVAFDGARLRTDKRRRLLRDLLLRVDRTHTLLAGVSLDERAAAVASVARDVLDLKHPLMHRYAPWLRSVDMARTDLIELDRLIALRCAERLTGRRGVRAFRELPPRILYGRHGLPSIVALWEGRRRPGARVR